MNFNKTTIGLVVATFVLGAAAGMAVPLRFAHVSTNATETTGGTTPAPAVPPPVPIQPGTAPDYRAIVTQNAPAVVGITTEEDVPIQETPFGNNPFGNDPFFQFFRNLPIPHGDLHERALGSGFIIDPDGLVLTNAHVVRNAKRVTVKLADRREFKAKVLGIDPTTDIAVLKIDAQHLPTVRLGNSDQLHVGDYVLAIGQPYGFEESATAGIVSAKGRSLPGDSSVPFIQTDVAVNPGNSGGPLFNSAGAVVGINSQIYSTTGGYQGLSFAIPINLALHIKSEIVAHGKVEHARLGIQIQPLTADLAASFGLEKPNGALVSTVDANSAAARAGLKPGDVITQYNGHPVDDPEDISAEVGMAEPGQHVTLTVWRGGKTLNIDASLGTAKQSAVAGNEAAPQGNSEAAHNQLGLAVRPLTPDERQQVGVQAGGLLVENVSGRAANAGIQPGDIVLAVNGTPVQSAEQMHDIVKQAHKEVALLIQRNDARIFVPVELG